MTVLVIAALCCAARGAYALGTAAGTQIDNVAQVTFTQGGASVTATSNTASFRIDEIINVRVTAPVGPTTVLSPEQNKAILFLLTNTGNGPESFNRVVLGGA
ncbi:MAG: hypothetical protein FJY56_16370 [Betaproteobacteria bacterium]|nr:hypothetical protein [Betaproteobacteria bacterium]